MRVRLVQSNPTVGALEANARQILRAIEDAEREAADAVLFPELSLCGYPPRDLLLDRGFVQETQRLARSLAAATGRCAAIFGFVDSEPDGTLYNALAFARAGAIEAVARKLLLPTYDVFDEARYFRPGNEPLLVSLGGRKVGIAICEDVWNDREFWGRSSYDREPVAELARRGMEYLLVASASPFSEGRSVLRVAMMRAFAERHQIAVAYLNQVGGNDSLVFDGASFGLDRSGRLIDVLPAFQEASSLLDLDVKGKASLPQSSSAEDAARALVLGLRDYVRKCGFEAVVLGLSGGIDSALCACLAVEALGKEHVSAAFMPSRYTSSASREDALAIAGALGIRLLELPIDPLARAYDSLLEEPFRGLGPDVTEENLQARIRGNLLMALSNKFGWLVLSTGNKSELAVGYCTLYGDMSGGLAVISDLPKQMVYSVARVLDERLHAIPERVFTRPPSAELRPDQQDQDTLPAYELLDPVLKAYVEDGLTPAEIVAQGFDAELVERVRRLVDRSEYKRRQAAPGLRVTGKAFGCGRRMPIARGYPGAQRLEPRATVETRTRLGIFGGSFNPPHRGHEQLAELVLERGLVDELWVVPVFQHPFGKELADFDDRMEMCRRAFLRLDPRIRVSAIERELGGPSYTVRTLERLREEAPSRPLFLVVGADTIKDAADWHDFERVRALAPLLVVPRGGTSEAEALPLEPPMQVSSSEIRGRIARAEPVSGMLSPEVEAYVKERGLYGALRSRPASGGGNP